MGSLPDLVVVGAMKCGTSALHAHLDAHPDIAMSRPKELNFFVGPSEPPHEDPSTWWSTGQWHRGVDWYAAQFDSRARVRGESSPAYTSPASTEAAERMARVLPGARLVYLVRDPVERAVSQWAHHRRDGTELRPVERAVLDEDSQYLARSSYFSRLEPYLDRYPREQLLVVVLERLLHDPRTEIARVHRHVGVDSRRSDDAGVGASGVADRGRDTPPGLREAFSRRIEVDLDRFRAWLGDELPEWRR